jgi:Leucine-rich repeat (LRR) protein
LFKFCSISKKINASVCNNRRFWEYKLNKDFPDWKSVNKEEENKTLKDLYLSYSASKIVKEKLKLKENVYEILTLPNIVVNGSAIIEIPPEIKYLENLEYLAIINTQISSIPPEIGDLVNLQDLQLFNNKIKSIPKEIGKLKKLKSLMLDDNRITDIPLEIENLTNLVELLLYNNPLKHKKGIKQWLKRKFPDVHIGI